MNPFKIRYNFANVLFGGFAGIAIAHGHWIISIVSLLIGVFVGVWIEDYGKRKWGWK